MLSWVPNKLNRLVQNTETNLGSLSETMTSGTPWCLTTVSMNTRASCGAVMVVSTGARCTRLDNLSTNTAMASFLTEVDGEAGTPWVAHFTRSIGPLLNQHKQAYTHRHTCNALWALLHTQGCYILWRIYLRLPGSAHSQDLCTCSYVQHVDSHLQPLVHTQTQSRREQSKSLSKSIPIS